MKNYNSDEFVRQDQEIMSYADNYFDYLYKLVKPYLNGKILEIGAGIGNITQRVLTGNYQSITCIEPDKNCLKQLESIKSKSGKPFDIYNEYFPEFVPDDKFDCIYHFNLLEHINNDIEALKISYQLLNNNGYLCLFVPAFPCLYGSMDIYLKHFRRYGMRNLTDKIQNSGFTIIEKKYSNFIGFFGWFINNRILKIKSQKPAQVYIFDKIILPIQAKLEKTFHFPFGQNIFIAAKK